MNTRSVAAKLWSIVLIVCMLLPALPAGRVLSQEEARPSQQDEQRYRAFLPLLSVSPRAAPEPTPTPEPAPEPVPELPPPGEQTGLTAPPPSAPPSPVLTVRVTISPTEAPPDGVVLVTLRLANEGGAAAHNVVISGTLPAGLECPRCGGFYDPGSRRLEWRLPAFPPGQVITRTFSLPVRGEAGWEGGVALGLGARGDETPRAVHGSAVLRVPYPLADGPASAFLPAGRGGELRSPDGRLALSFPPEAVAVNLTVLYSPTAVPDSGYIHPLRTFAVVARDASGQEVHSFPAPVEVAYRYTWAEALGLDPEELFLARWDEAGQTWVRLPSRVDPGNRLLRAQTDHFSPLLAGYFKLPSDDYMPQLQGFQEIDLFSGGASYSYPIEVPAGRGGLAPQLALSYNSTGVDWPASPWDHDVQASWVGYGWSLDVGSISRANVGGFVVNTQTCEQTGTPFSRGDVYSLVLNGSSHDLVLGTDGLYHTMEETYWKIWTSGGAVVRADQGRDPVHLLPADVAGGLQWGALPEQPSGVGPPGVQVAADGGA
jgi:hypothetical protein